LANLRLIGKFLIFNFHYYYWPVLAIALFKP
jgi:hypothetical protein